MIKKILFLLLLNVSLILPQNLDSLFNLYVSIKTGQSFVSDKPAEQHHGKCAFGVTSFIRLNRNKFSPAQQVILNQLDDRPICDTSFVTPSGLFRVHYDLTGVNKPGYSINSLAVILDSVYAFEVGFLGYPPPPADLGIGGDDLYDVYVQNLGNREYGYTDWDVMIGNETYTSYQVINNNFIGFYTTGLNAVRVTAAHEFHHAIQAGNYILSDDRFYHEITSVAMEEFAYDNVNDYIFYLHTYFEKPYLSFSSFNYSLGIWNIFLKERFGYDVIKRTWELMRSKRAITAINIAISEQGSTFKEELDTFGIWTYHTGYRAVPNKYFKDAALFPLITYSNSYNFLPPLKEINLNTKPASNNFIKFAYNTDTLTAIITNGDFANAIDNVNFVLAGTYSLSSQENNGFTKINDNYYYSFSSPSSSYFCVANLLNDYSSVFTGDMDNYVYPQPFNYTQYATLLFPAKKNETNEAKLYVYNANMNLVFQTKANLTSGSKPMISWNGYSSSGRLPSGVYIYVTDSDGEIIKGKFVIFND
ncbi:MAG: T9SS type A sorting domain-containing protein [bacterium]